MTEKDKMISGLAYRANDPELIKQRLAVRKILGMYNQTGVQEAGYQVELLQGVLGKMGDGSWIEPPFIATMVIILRQAKIFT